MIKFLIIQPFNNSISKTNNGTYVKKSKRKLIKEMKMENIEKRRFVLRNKILNTINGNFDKNKTLNNELNKSIKNKFIKNIKNDSSFNKSYCRINNKKRKIKENSNDNYNNQFNDSLEIRDKIMLKIHKPINLNSKNIYKK